LFAAPTRAIDMPQKPGSQAIVEAIETKVGELVIISWLRSSQYAEVREHTGMLRDTRRETVAVRLPCRRASKLRVYSVLGNTRRSRTSLLREELQGVDLNGESVFIASLRCQK
jgi:hypothetical protein